MKIILRIALIVLYIFTIGKINPMEDNGNGNFDSLGRYITALIVTFVGIFLFIYIDKMGGNK